MLTVGRLPSPRRAFLVTLLAAASLITRPGPPKQSFQHDLPRPVPGPDAVATEPRWVAGAAGDEVRVYELGTGKPTTVLPIQAAHTAKFAKNRLFVAGQHYAEMYETPSFKRLWRYTMPCEMATVSDNASLIVLGRNRPNDNNLTVQMLDGKGQPVWYFNGIGMAIKSFDAGTDGRHLVIEWSKPDNVFYLYNPWQKRFMAEGGGRAALSAGYLTQLFQGRLRIVDLDRALLVGPIQTQESTVSFAPDSEHVLAGHRTFRAEDLQATGAAPTPGRSRFLAPGHTVATWQNDGQTVLWQAKDGATVTASFQSLPTVTALAGTGRKLAVAGGEKLRVWEW